jgi:hypothetical protein
MKFSEEASLYSQLTQGLYEYGTKEGFPETANDALDILLVLPLVVKQPGNYYQIERLRNHLGHLVSRNQGQGDWKKVERILLSSTSCHSVIETWNLIAPEVHERSWFGNVIPRLRRAIKMLKLKRMYPLHYSNGEGNSPKDPNVKKPQRKRGYNDKGSRRPPERWLPTELGELGEQQKYVVLVKEPPKNLWFRFFQVQRKNRKRSKGWAG